ncbi:MAG: hypothetical protein IPO55_03550 [Alphaproteobacteria bacterium]|nr:hypothetical protein [Alphaproteobacteria bacterium]
MKNYKIVYCVTALFLLSGCSTIVEGKTQSVSVSTPGAEGAICTLSSPAIGNLSIKTPDTIMVQKSKHNIDVRCTKDCYEDTVGTIPSSFEGMTFGNIIFGGIIGVGVDAASGAMNNYQPSLMIQMTKKTTPECAGK